MNFSIDFTNGKSDETQILSEATLFFLGVIFKRFGNRKKCIDISIEIIDDIDSGYAGYLDVESKYEYNIVLDSNLNLMGKISTIAHEIIHIYQNYNSRLYLSVHKNIRKYFEDPTEMEAYSLERYLMMLLTIEYRDKDWFFDPFYLKV